MDRFQAVVAALPESTATLLDVGCGPGVLLELLRQQKPAIHAVGLERSELAIATNRRMFGVEVVQGSADQLPFESASFDVVTACEVIEHLPYGVFERALAELQRVARNTIVVTVPYGKNRAFVQCPYCGCTFSQYYHLRHFEEPGLRQLLADFDAVTLKILYSRGDLPGVNAVLGWVNKFRRSSDLPQYALCPQCGYRSAKSAAAPNEGGATPRRSLGRMFDAATRWIPRPRKARWGVVMYRRRKAIA